MKSIDRLADSNFKRVYKDPRIINCEDCDKYIRATNSCSNMYESPKVPCGYGCKNGRLVNKKIPLQKKRIIDIIFCNILKLHEVEHIGHPVACDKDKILVECKFCRKKGLLNPSNRIVNWNIVEENIYIKELIEKFNY